MTDLTALLQSLVQIPSPNPPGNTTTIAGFVQRLLLDQGVADVRVLAPPEKPEAVSVVASVGSGEPVILLHAHIDTVPIADDEARQWRVDPYAAAIQDG